MSDIIHGSYHVLVMEKLGVSVKTIIQSNDLSHKTKISNLLLFSFQAIQRLQDVHSHNIIHNDIKPSNFLLGSNNSDMVYIIDFGISTIYKNNGLHILYTDGIEDSGTPGYQSFHNLLGVGET